MAGRARPAHLGARLSEAVSGAGGRLRAGLPHAASLLAIALGSTVLHSLSVNFPDPDSFYHLRHAWVYATRGLAHGSFPWLEFSLVGRTGADLWYGFHVLLVPLTGFGDLRDGLIYGGVLCTAGALA
ncbi:MAG TPA: hypothetical protein VII13_05315, partial [Vicinamibacteria bacterium]